MIPCPKISICWWICIANSKLGAMINAKMLIGSFDSSFKSGRPKAAVFPDPVYEFIIKLLPWSTWGIVNYWMAVGALYLIFSHVFTTQLDNLSLLKDILNTNIIIFDYRNMPNNRHYHNIISLRREIFQQEASLYIFHLSYLDRPLVTSKSLLL